MNHDDEFSSGDRRRAAAQKGARFGEPKEIPLRPDPARHGEKPEAAAAHKAPQNGNDRVQA